VFAYSYQRLSTAEKASFCQLAIFNSRFDVGAAQTVAIASEATLDLLVSHSLLKVNPTDEGLTKRYEMHRLLRQFALEQLVIEHELKEELETRYIDYFIDFLDQRGEGLRQGGPTSLFTEVEVYIDDIREVWQRLILILAVSANDRWIKAEQSLEALCNFYFAKGWIAEGLELVEKLASLDHGSTFSLRSALWQAEFEAGLGNYPTADSVFKNVLIRSQQTGSRLVELEALNGLGRVKYLQGDMETAEKLFQEGLDLARYEEDPISISLALNCLANTIAEAYMDYDKSIFFLAESLDISRAAGDQLGTARALINLGAVAQERNQLKEAQDLYQQSLDLYQTIGYQHGIAAALNYLGQIAIKKEDFTVARELLKQSINLYLTNGDQRGEADVLRQMGNIARGQRKVEEALTHYEDALAIAQTIGGDLLGLAVLLEVAELHKIEGKPDVAAQVATQILDHPAVGDEVATLARRLLTDIKPCQTKDLVDSDLTLGQMVEIALAA
ncbi:MAG: tetratricopeptide repeat protein, partial [Anaerolineae bacterium]